ncbi:Eco57I restriction-modification methylase domain-containing protein [Prevotella histicola]|uniref:Eco57I restriction-modification methylase domain-containing protein n=1 Tax=Prevotella histicola TaxID=470565 RepID=UPI0028802634|nr:DNA methyltransferase [Prevotella histicola]
MKRNIFNQYITVSDFKGLFVSEMLWNNPTGATQLPEITIDNTTFHIEQIAERKGFQILYCQVDQIPSSTICKKIDHKIRKNAENYICIFILPGTLHHLWVAPVKKVEKRDVVLIEYDSLDKAAFLFEKMESLSFSLDDNLTILDIIEKVQAAFLINSEKITKDFYAGFKKEHSNFAKFITGIDDHIDEKENKNKQWYASVMLNRLMFCYFIQKKEFLDGDVDYLRHKLEWTRDQEGEDRFFNKFYKGFLVNLFHDGLNTPKHNHEFEKIYGRIPYLNGGMFDVHQIERDYAELDIADEAFISLFDFFDKWHWHLDDRMTASGRDINPDVLGYIFEQYINDRAQMGAYYTKEDITEYIGRNTIVPYLMDTVKRKDEKHFCANSELWQYLKESGDKYIFDAMKKGGDQIIPEEIAIGLDTTKPNLLGRRCHWNERTPEAFALPTEIWRETIERLQRYNNIKEKIVKGEITDINDFITYNLNIRQFVTDYLANTQNHLFVKHFYYVLQHVTILDPTCGSGAFLFAALNILEPLYEVCINRMQEFNAKNSQLFKQELQEIEHKYRSNIQYFIYKSIILRNLYGVDIMVEATEIAKLRLFLKMVAVVEVDKRDPNLGLDPLPDIDFNIRCGNTLVGYATQEELERDLIEGDMFAREEFKAKVNDEMDKVSRTYEIFKYVQLHQAENMAAFKKAKSELYQRLNTLNDLLNHKMYGAVESAKGYDAWYQTHQPFHWLAEFYEIINEHGGFDVIIGNPPYVSKSKIAYLSKDTFTCSDLYGYVIKRVLQLLCPVGTHGFIVMHNLAFSRNFVEVRNLLNNFHGSAWYSFYSRIPSGLFSGDVRVRNCIYILSSDGNKKFTSCLHRWFSEQRASLFTTTMKYYHFDYSGVIPMLDSEFIQSIYENKRGYAIAALEDNLNGICLYYKKVGYNFLSISNIKPNAFDLEGNPTPQTKLGTLKFLPQYNKYIQLLCCGKLYISKWLTYGDDFDVTGKDITSFTFPFNEISNKDKETLDSLYEEFCKNLPSTIQYKLNAGIKVGTFNTAMLWDITDKSDMIFLSYLTDNSLLVREVIENHLAKCILSNK